MFLEFSKFVEEIEEIHKFIEIVPCSYMILHVPAARSEAVMASVCQGSVAQPHAQTLPATPGVAGAMPLRPLGGKGWKLQVVRRCFECRSVACLILSPGLKSSQHLFLTLFDQSCF